MWSRQKYGCQDRFPCLAPRYLLLCYAVVDIFQNIILGLRKIFYSAKINASLYNSLLVVGAFSTDEVALDAAAVSDITCWALDATGSSENWGIILRVCVKLYWGFLSSDLTELLNNFVNFSSHKSEWFLTEKLAKKEILFCVWWALVLRLECLLYNAGLFLSTLR